MREINIRMENKKKKSVSVRPVCLFVMRSTLEPSFIIASCMGCFEPFKMIAFILTSDKVYHMTQDNNARESALLANFSDREYKLFLHLDMIIQKNRKKIKDF